MFEPFSKIEDGLAGKTMIENFLKVVVMANAGFKHTIRFIDESEDRIIAIVTFERGDSVTGMFAFNFIMKSNSDGAQVSKKTDMLRIQFIEDY